VCSSDLVLQQVRAVAVQLWGGARFDTARIRCRKPLKRPSHKASGDFGGRGGARRILQEMTAKCADFAKILTLE